MKSTSLGETPNRSIFGSSRLLLMVAVSVLFGIGLAIRLYDLTDLPLDFHSTRQMHSVLMARGMYYENLPGIPDWQRKMAVEQWHAEGLIEPPVMERLTAVTYSLIGREDLTVPRLYGIFFWLVGGLGLFLLMRDLAGVDGAVVGLAYYLILPYGALASRAFQPEPLLVSLIIFALYAQFRWYRKPGWKTAVTAGLLGGCAIFIKSVAVFFVVPAWLAWILAAGGWRKALRDPQVWVQALLIIIPYALFHIYGVYISGELAGQFNLRFFPQLWRDPVFYLRWNGEMSSVLGLEWTLVALAGIFTLRDRAARTALAALWAGYFLFGMTLPYHISTHDYYQLPMVPVVAIGLAAAAGSLLPQLKAPRALLFPLVIGLVVFWVGIKAWDVRVTLKRNDYRSEPAIWENLASSLGRESHVIGLFQDYGYRLKYWGWLTPTNWMTTGDFNVRQLAGMQYDIDSLFAEQTEGKDYFVVTMFSELESQPELKKLLYANYPVLQETGDALIFDLRHPLPTTIVQ